MFNEVGDYGLRTIPTGANLYVGGVQLASPGNIPIAVTSYSGPALQGTTTPGQVAYDWIHNGPERPSTRALPHVVTVTLLRA